MHSFPIEVKVLSSVNNIQSKWKCPPIIRLIIISQIFTFWLESSISKPCSCFISKGSFTGRMKILWHKSYSLLIRRMKLFILNLRRIWSFVPPFNLCGLSQKGGNSKCYHHQRFRFNWFWIRILLSPFFIIDVYGDFFFKLRITYHIQKCTVIFPFKRVFLKSSTSDIIPFKKVEIIFNKISEQNLSFILKSY